MSVWKYMYNLDLEDTSDKLKKIRRRLGLNQDEMATKMEISKRTYTRFENMETLPERKYIYKFIEVTGIDKSELIDEQPPKLILNDSKQSYGTENDEIELITEAIKEDKALRKLIINILRYAGALK